MAGHILRADADDRAPPAPENPLGADFEGEVSRKKTHDAPRLAEEEAPRAQEKARRADEANAKLVEFAKTLESESRTWTDFSKASFHSRSAFLLDGVWSGVDAFGGIRGRLVGRRARPSRGPARPSRAAGRRSATGCRFQVFAEDLGGFGGLAAATLEELKDEYPRQPAWLFSLRPPLPSSREAREEGRHLPDSSAAAAAEAARYFLLNDALATATLARRGATRTCLWVRKRRRARGRPTRFPPGSSGRTGGTRFRAGALAAACADVAGTSWRARGPTCAPGARDLRDVARHLSARAGGPFVSASFVIDPEPGGSGAREAPPPERRGPRRTTRRRTRRRRRREPGTRRRRRGASRASRPACAGIGECAFGKTRRTRRRKTNPRLRRTRRAAYTNAFKRRRPPGRRLNARAPPRPWRRWTRRSAWSGTARPGCGSSRRRPCLSR